ncbi:glycosyltransferase family 2 protein [Vibrio aestuarianus]|uniref:glycosyltransferase family 2 protein n=1 Tax=Vibrio aestuarianus TaxID=28171 RepID=UPI0023A56132|nr:glycosyltransferase family 2 protein [Vibrio aestuarianus]MDE1294017.1 glycosyltransferase [Vibrio aestuarianus]
MKPLVTIIIPTYNAANFIRESLLSIVNQTWENIEIIIGDNASTDDTESRIEDIIKEHKHIVYIKNKENVGYSKNCNDLMKMSKGKYISIFHSDDIYSPFIVEEQVKYMEEHPRILGCFTNFTPIDEDGDIIKGRIKSYSYKDKFVIYDRKDFISELLENRHNPLFCPSSMIRKEVYDRVGGYSEDLFEIFDQDMWLRILTIGKLAVINNELVKYRFHNKQLSYIYRDPQLLEVSPFVTNLAKYLERNDKNTSKINRLYSADIIFKSQLAAKNNQSYEHCKRLIVESKNYYVFSLKDGFNYLKFFIYQKFFLQGNF